LEKEAKTGNTTEEEKNGTCEVWFFSKYSSKYILVFKY
jgi:hypothetical protein